MLEFLGAMGMCVLALAVLALLSGPEPRGYRPTGHRMMPPSKGPREIPKPPKGKGGGSRQ